MRVCHITSVHKAHDVRIFEKECTSLAASGFDTFLVVPNTSSTVINGVNVVGVPCHNTGRLSRMLNTTKKVISTAINLKADIYHFHDPELLLYAKTLKKSGAKVIYDAHEDLPRQILDKPYLPKFFRGIISWLVEKVENYVLKNHVSGVVTATPYIKKRFEKIGLNTANINNYPILAAFNTPGKWTERTSEVCYVGGIFKTRGAFEMVEMLSHTNTKLHVAGNFSPESLRDELVETKGWSNVIEHGFVDRLAINSILSKCKVGLVLLHPTESYIHSLPIKMFEYMAAGIPVIASNFKLWQQIIEEYQCGVCVNPFDTVAIADAVRNLLDNDEYAKQLGENGRRAIEEMFNWEKESEKLVEFYQKIASN